MTTTEPSEATTTIDEDTKIFVAGVLGESSQINSLEEMTAIAEVLIRQKKARQKNTWKDFAQKEPSFAFAFSDENPRYALVMNTNNRDIATKEPMATAFKAVVAAQGGSNLSNGAYFWDGLDFKVNKKGKDNVKHPKRVSGFKYGKTVDNIFNVPEHKINMTKNITTVVKGEKTQITVFADSVYESTVAYSGTYPVTRWESIKDENGEIKKIKVNHQKHTGTIFWKFNPDYVTHFHNGKEHI